MTRSPSGHNLGELIRRGTTLTTREVLALVHEVCRDATATFPPSPDGLWITDTGELMIAGSDQIAGRIDPRHGAASLLEAMLPPEGRTGPQQIVPAALRGLPSRLRASREEAGPHDRKDLLSILSWHLDDDPRRVIQQLAARVGAGDTAEASDLELFPESPESVHAPDHESPTKRRSNRVATVLALFAMALLFIAIGSASYWLSRVEPEPDTVHRPRAGAAVVPVDVAPPAPLALDVAEGAFSPAFAATGRELFFHAGRASAGRLLVAHLDDAGQVSRVSAVRSDAGRNYHPRVSPDGRLIAFDSDRDGERGVYVTDRTGTQLQRVSGAGYGAVPSWSPDMKWLAFIRGEATRPRVWNLWLRDLETGVLQRHTAFRSGQVWGASWFPDARSICYSHDEHLIISHLDAREDIVIETPRRGHLVRTPAVSPDGRRVVFQVFKDGVWLLDVHTRSMRRILDDATAEEFAWSPDGGRIAYHSRRDGEWRIWVMAMQ